MSDWTRAQVEDRLRQALITLRRMPGGHLFPAGIRVAWPEIAKEWSAYGWDRATKPRVQATAEDIRQMDVALGWTSRLLCAPEALRRGLPEDAVKIVMWRAAGRRWDQIGVWRAELWGMRPTARGGRSAIPGGNSYPSLTAIYRRAIDVILEDLNGRRDPDAQLREEEAQVQMEAVVEVSYPVGEVGTYGPVRARAQHVVREKRRRGA